MRVMRSLSLFCLMILLIAAPMTVSAEDAFVFDDFEADTLDTSKWDTSGNVSVEDGRMVLRGHSQANMKTLPYQSEAYVNVFAESTDRAGERVIFLLVTITPNNDDVLVKYTLRDGDTEGVLQTQWVDRSDGSDTTIELGPINRGENINLGMKYTIDGDIQIIKNGEVVHTHTGVSGVDKTLNGENTIFRIESYTSGETDQGVIVGAVEEVKVQQSPNHNMPKYAIEFWHLMKRRYEEGNKEITRVGFGIKDMEGNYVQENPFVSVKVFDPDGNEMTSGDHFFGAYATVSGQYIPEEGKWYYKNDFSPESSYGVDYSVPLKQGQYKIVAEDADGLIYEHTEDFSGNISEQPLIISETFKAYRDGNGDFHMKWDVPEGIDRTVPTSVRAWISAYPDEQLPYSTDIYIKIPTDLGFMVIPGNLIDKLAPLGTVYKIGVHLRANDGTYRSYSKQVKLDDNFAFTGSAVEGNTGECPTSSYPSISDLSILDLFIPAINVQGAVTPLNVHLEKIQMDNDPLGLYWKLNQ